MLFIFALQVIFLREITMKTVALYLAGGVCAVAALGANAYSFATASLFDVNFHTICDPWRAKGERNYASLSVSAAQMTILGVMPERFKENVDAVVASTGNEFSFAGRNSICFSFPDATVSEVVWRENSGALAIGKYMAGLLIKPGAYLGAELTEEFVYSGKPLHLPKRQKNRPPSDGRKNKDIIASIGAVAPAALNL